MWLRLDTRLWTNSVEFPGLLSLTDSPAYGLKQYYRGVEVRSFWVEHPIPEMMPAVEAIEHLVPMGHRTGLKPIEEKYVFRPKAVEEPNKAPEPTTTAVTSPANECIIE